MPVHCSWRETSKWRVILLFIAGVVSAVYLARVFILPNGDRDPVLLEASDPELWIAIRESLSRRKNQRAPKSVDALADDAMLADIQNTMANANSLRYSEWAKGFCSPLEQSIYLGRRKSAIHCAQNGLFTLDDEQCKTTLTDIIANKGDLQLIETLAQYVRTTKNPSRVYTEVLGDIAHKAILLGQFDNCSAALQAGVPIDIYIATGLGATDAVTFLLARGSRLSDSDRMGNSVLHYCGASESCEILTFLLQSGASVSKSNEQGETVLHVASRCGWKDGVRLLLDQGAMSTARTGDAFQPIHLAASHGHLDCVGLLVHRGVSIGERARHGWTCLHIAAREGHTSVVEWLLREGEQPDVRLESYVYTVSREPYCGGWTALHCASAAGNDDIVRLLIQYGADRMLRTAATEYESGSTPLELAVRHCHIAVVRELVADGVDRVEAMAAIELAQRERAGVDSSSMTEEWGAWGRERSRQYSEVIRELDKAVSHD